MSKYTQFVEAAKIQRERSLHKWFSGCQLSVATPGTGPLRRALPPPKFTRCAPPCWPMVRAANI